MPNLLTRLERLERQVVRVNPIRIVRRIIGCEDGRPVPWEPTTARCGHDSITRLPEETPEAFEARALSHFPNDRLIIG